jgi:hypothetical protein
MIYFFYSVFYSLVAVVIGQKDFPGRKIKCKFLVMLRKALFNNVLRLPIVNGSRNSVTWQ